MKTRLLTINEAWELYKLIKNHFPEKIDTEVIVVDFISDFVDSVAQTDPDVLLQILDLLLEDGVARIESMAGTEVFMALVEGFQQNKVFDLFNFFVEITKK